MAVSICQTFSLPTLNSAFHQTVTLSNIPTIWYVCKIMEIQCLLVSKETVDWTIEMVG